MSNELIKNGYEELLANNYRFYHESLVDFIGKNKDSIKESDVVSLITALTKGLSISFYYSFKDFLPQSTLDFDFLRAHIINNLVDEFKKISEYDPRTRYERK